MIKGADQEQKISTAVTTHQCQEQVIYKRLDTRCVQFNYKLPEPDGYQICRNTQYIKNG